MKRTECFLVIILMFVLTLAAPAAGASKKPATVAELALYKGPDRQQLMEEGARKEGKLTFYTVHIAHGELVAAFEKKYPYLKVETWRAGTNALAPRILEEYKIGKHTFDAVEATQMSGLTLQKAGVLQPYYSVNSAVIDEDAITKAPGGGALSIVYREGYIGLGYNKSLMAKEQVPKTYGDLLDARWKGKMPISGDSTGADWLGTILMSQGEEFVKRLARQDFQVHMVSPRALLDMIINGEYLFSPTIYESHVVASKKKDAPVEWLPLEPVHVNAGRVALARHARNPHAALLFIDFVLSQESAELNRATGFMSPRKDMPDKVPYKKFYGVRSLEEGRLWSNLFKQLFVK